METAISFIIIFGVLVFVHELGHLVFAKRAGIMCREFAIGFGPKVFSFKKEETVYTIRLLPIGGFVRMAGEDPEMIDVKPGYHVGLLFNNNGEVEKVIMNNKEKFPNAKVIEVEKADLEHEMFIKGYELNDEEESLVEFKVSEESYFVIDGQDVQIAPYNRQFASKTLRQRTMAIFAGPMMNFILAFVIFAFLGVAHGYPVNKAELGELTPDGAAIAAGLEKGDKVVAINNESVTSWEEIVDIIKVNANEELLFLVERNGQSVNIPVTPKQDTIEGESRGVIGVYMPMEKSIVSAIPNAAKETYGWTRDIIIGLGKLITGQFSIDMLSGPVGIYKSTEVVAESGVFLLMRWAAVLSINLGIINLLPIPALDGGRLMFFAVEAVRGKPVDRHKEGLVHFIGFALLMLLMLVVTWNDIQRFFL